MKYTSGVASWNVHLDKEHVVISGDSSTVSVDLPFGVKGRRYNGRLRNASHRAYPASVLQVELDAVELVTSHDIVLTTYESLKRSASVYKKFHWHRIVLDECQEVKMPTNQIAKLCADLESNHRWMVSGTPFFSSIEDLHGELNFLKVCISY